MNAPKVIANLVAAIGERIRFYRSARGWWIEIVTRRRPRRPRHSEAWRKAVVFPPMAARG